MTVRLGKGEDNYEALKIRTMGEGAGLVLNVQEMDGDPSVNNVTTIIVPNGTLTDDGGGAVEITSLANYGTAQYQYLSTGASPYLAGWTDYVNRIDSYTKVESDATEGLWLRTFSTCPNGHRNECLWLGFNLASGMADTASAIGWGIGFERDYWDTSSVHYAEWYLNYYPASGSYVRPMQQIINQGTGEIVTSIAGKTSFFSSSAVQHLIVEDSGEFDLAASNARIRHLVNNVGFMYQMNASGTTLVHLLHLDNYDRVIVDPGGYGCRISTGAGKVGFYAASPIAKQTSVDVSASGIHAALVNLGLFT